MQSKTLKLLQVGVLHPQKGQRVAIEVVKLILDKGLKTELTFVGDGPDKKELENYTKKLGVSRNVKFAGYVPSKKVISYYKKSDLILLPSIGETFSSVPLEALKVGKISILTDDSGAKELLDGICLFSKPESESFYIAVLDFLKNRKKYEERSAGFLKIMKEELNWEKYATKFVEVVMSQVPPEVYDKKYFTTHLINPKTRELFVERQTRIGRGIKLLDIKKNKKILDLGCGNGEVSEKMEKLGAKVYGIDYSKDAISMAKKMGLKAQFKTGKISDLPYPDNFFDGVISLDVFEHVYPVELSAALTEIKRVTKDGGRIVVATAPNSFYLGPVEFFAKLFMGIKNFESNEYHINIFNYFRFKRLFKDFRGKKQVFMTNDGHSYFYSRIVKNRKMPNWIKTTARFVDWVFENPISERIIFSTPLQIFLAHDLWVKIDIRK